MYKPNAKPVQKSAKFIFALIAFFLGQGVWGEGLVNHTGTVVAVEQSDERGYIWNSGLVKILEEAGVAVASPRSIDPKLRLHYYLAECDQVIATGNLVLTDEKIQEALLDLTGMRGLLERQARVAGMSGNYDRANTYWASVVTHPSATLDNFADAAWSYLMADQLAFGELILEMGEKRDAEHPRLLLLRKIYQFKKGQKAKAGVLHASDIPSLAYRIHCRKKEIERLGGGWLFEDLCGWILRGGELASDLSHDAAPVMMEDGTLLYFSEKPSPTLVHSDVPASVRLAKAVERLQRIQKGMRTEDWEAVLVDVAAVRELGGAGYYLDVLEMQALGKTGRPMKSRSLAQRLLNSLPEHSHLYYIWGRLLMSWGAYQEALGVLEKCQSLGYKGDIMEAWLAACYAQLFNDLKATEYIREGLTPGKAQRFKTLISQDENYWAEVRRLVLAHEKPTVQ